MKVSRIAGAFATVDVVTCDLTRDPRSEDYVATAHHSGFFPKRCGAVLSLPVFQNERPPSMSTVRALK